MARDYCKRSGQIPAFGKWDHATDFPITQYFHSATQAGLLRRTSFPGDADLYADFHGGAGGLYDSEGLNKPDPPLSPPIKARAVRERRGAAQGREQKRQGKVCDIAQAVAAPRRVRKHRQSSSSPSPQRPRDGVASRHRKVPGMAPGAVDEDLYKIPPELLRDSASKPRQKKMMGFISRCLVPACSS